MNDESSATDAAIHGMVVRLRPEWTVDAIRRSEHGTDLVAFLDVVTPAGTLDVVLKATTADFVPPVIARSEPRLLDLVGRETSIPVPEVFGFADSYSEYPAPFYLMERVPGENYEGRPADLAADARERVVVEAGQHLAALHDLGTLPQVGRVGVHEGELTVLDGEHGPVDDFREWVRADVEDALDALANGTYYPDLATKPDRFADLVPALREALDARLASLPEPAPPRYCHWDYRYGNLLVDPETGATRAVLDWANLLAAEPAYNLAKTESHLLDPGADDSTERAAALSDSFRDAYAAERDEWAFTDAIEQRIETYRLKCRVDAMACLPLWLQDATPAERDDRERQHRTFVASYL